MIQITKIIASLAIVAGIATLASCTTIRNPDPSTHTSSTTTDTIAPQPEVVPSTTETQTVRTY